MLYIVKISRSKDKQGLPTTFQVNIHRDITIISLLEYLQQYHDPSIAFTYSCRTGLCGTCTVLVNGKPTLSCLTLAKAKDNYLHLSPLAKREIISDLVTHLS